MATASELLSEAGSSLSRAEALIARAASTVGPPCEEPLVRIAVDVERIRKRLRNAATTATAGGGRG